MQQTYPHLKNQCCRLKTQVDDETLQKIIDNAQDNNSNIYPDQDTGNFMQFDMSNDAEGYPCVHLGEEGCTIHPSRPSQCASFPLEEKSIEFCTGCSYTFSENEKRSGSCNGCNIV
jgi:Fe-S-cluster containining protein